MGSAASKVESHQSRPSSSVSRTQSAIVKICSEQNNNLTVEKCTENATTGKPNHQRIQRSASTSESFVAPLPPIEPNSQNKKVASFPQKTEVVSPQNKKVASFPQKTEVVSLKPISTKTEKPANDKEDATVKQLKEELSTSESQRLDLQDQIQLLEGRCASREQQRNVKSVNFDALQETLNSKDVYILKLEREAKANQAETNKMRIKLKKRNKALTNQLLEVRQEASISQMELKAEIAKQAEQIKSLNAGQTNSTSSSPEDGRNSGQEHHSKIIVELSSQLSEQAETISSLEVQLSEKKKEISDLKVAISNHYDSQDTVNTEKSNTALLSQTSTDRLPSSRGKRVRINNDERQDSLQSTHNDSFNPSPTLFDSRHSRNSTKTLERQSTTLSDSDSDWGDGGSIPSHTNSAPPRSRVKSAVSLSSSGRNKGSLTTLNGNDDSIMDLVSAASPIDRTSERRTDSGKKSTYKNHMEKVRKENQSNSLIGPTLAFEMKAEPFSDTSCEPTPRTQRATLPANAKIRIVKPIVH